LIVRTLIPIVLLACLGCDARQGRVLAWYADRYAEPGGAATIEVGLWQVLDGKIARVEVESAPLGLPRTTVLDEGDGPSYGVLLQVKRGAPLPGRRIEVPIPRGAPAGERAVTLRVAYGGAEGAGAGQFKPIGGEETLVVQVMVGGELAGRARDVALPLGLLLLAALLCGLLAPVGGQPAWRGVLVAVVGLAWAGAAFHLFVRPVSWAIGVTSWWKRGLVGGAGLLALIVVASLIAGARARRLPPSSG
jgi:hypothetical protein